jgi:NAD(P)-dependent dehydrogenase (short-subunit alcohol dehydrogenase family)
MHDLFDLHGRTALVTGATGGLGIAICEALATHGAEVIVSDIEASACEDLAGRLRDAGWRARGVAADLSRHGQVDALVAAAGAVDVLVCNAGIQGPARPMATLTEADIDRVLDLNLKSALWLTAGLVPGMAARGAGSVILISSIAGLRGNRAIGLYGLSKAALAQLARNLAVEWGPCGVRSNAISPGLIRTPLAEPLLADAAFMQRRLALTPLRRVGEPHEIAGVVVMLAAQAGAFINGHNLVVDGGTTIGDGS